MANGIQAGDAVWAISGDLTPLEQSLKQGESEVNKSTGNITQSFSTIGKGMTALGASITAPLALGVSAATDFGSAMAAVATLGVEDMQGLEDSVRSIAVTYGQDLTGAAEGAYQAISAGVSAAEAPRVLEEAAKAAAAGQSDLTTAIELGTSMTNAFGLEMTDMSGVFDSAFIAVKAGVTTFEELASGAGKTAPAFAAAGLSIDELYGSVAALTKGGLGTAESFTSLNAVIASFTRQGEVSKLETLGLEGALQWLKETTGGNQTEMLEFLGSTQAMTAVLALTGGQAESFNEIMGQMGEKTGAAGEAFNIIAESDPAFAWNQLKASMQDLAIEVGQALLPALHSLLGIVTPMIQGITSWIKEHDTLAATITVVAGAFGAFLLAVGPILMMIPGIVALVQAFSAVLGVGGLATSATAATTAIGTAGGSTGLLGAFVAIGTLSAPAIIAIGAIGIALAALGISLWKTKEAYDQLDESEAKLKAGTDQYIESLKAKGVAINDAMLATMTYEEQMRYTADAEKAHADTLARAWFEYYAGRKENEQEFAQMRSMMLNEEISAQEAAIVASSKMSEEYMQQIMTADAETTNSLLENLDVRAKVAADTEETITSAQFQAALERNNMWMTETHALTASQAELAAQVNQTWADAIGQMFTNLAQFVAGLPLDLLSFLGIGGGGTLTSNTPPSPHAEGGQLHEGMNIVGERGPEAIIKHGSEMRVITAENTAAMGGGGVTINMNATIGSDMDIQRVAQRLGKMLEQRMTGVGSSPAMTRI